MIRRDVPERRTDSWLFRWNVAFRDSCESGQGIGRGLTDALWVEASLMHYGSRSIHYASTHPARRPAAPRGHGARDSTGC
ncbi:hypothetical protein CgunFtcFv8_016998 [Champsocephalus gunnari]|uniref:Uncharacterized protein n=1 Tax=Champsocephalus gunnari TaxID=52237 RepID=A0AAN8CRL4_CHAGU|nr:hypothetical protein CgunFtcFv8_016998 [Champsocephalus gunnari]